MKVSDTKSKFLCVGINEKNADQLDSVLKGLPHCINRGIYKRIKATSKTKKNAYAGAMITRINELSNVIDTRMINAVKLEINDAAINAAEMILYLKHELPALSFTALIDLFYTNFNSSDIPKILLPKSGVDNNLLTPIEVKFWQKKISKTIRQNREQIAYRLGLIGKNGLKYCTNECVNEDKQDILKLEEFAKSLVMVNKLTGESFPAEESHSAKSQSYSENVCLLNELNQYGLNHNFSAALVTITVPSSMHMSYQKKSDLSPSDVNNYILKGWQKYMNQSTQWTSPCFSFKVIEPHEDGSPHWHIILFYPKKMQDRHQKALLAAFDLTSFKSKRIFWNILKNDDDKENAIAYLLKKIKAQSSAEIKYASTVSRRSAFLKVWNIRGQEFYGLPFNTKTLWRELRSKKYPFTLCKELEQLRIFATTNQFASFLDLYMQHKDKIQIIKAQRETSNSKKTVGIQWNNTEFLAQNSDYEKMSVRKAESIILEKTTGLTINKPRPAETHLLNSKSPINHTQNNSQSVSKPVRTPFLIIIRNKTSEFTKFLFKKFRALKNPYISCKTLVSSFVSTQNDAPPS